MWLEAEPYTRFERMQLHGLKRPDRLQWQVQFQPLFVEGVISALVVEGAISAPADRPGLDITKETQLIQ